MRQVLKAMLSSLARRGGMISRPRKRLAGKVGVVIPTINSGRYIDLILAYYHELSIPVTVFIDSKSKDNTAEVAKLFAHEVVTLSNPTPRVGEIIQPMSDHCDTEWVLRMDDDELPSVDMLWFIQSIVESRACDVVGFPRYQALIGCDQLLFDRTQDSDIHRQWRLYRPDRVRFHGKGHTPGFDFKERRALKAPADALMIHLDWVVHSPEERIRKLQRYEAHTPGHGWSRWDHYLGDTVPDLAARLHPLPLKEFSRTCRYLAARFPSTVVGSGTRRPVHTRPRHSRLDAIESEASPALRL